MTNQEINRLSAPVVQAYRDMEDEVLRLIAKQIAKDGRLSDTSKWRIRQLARAGEVNRQALDIIDSYSGGISAEVYDAILAAAEGEVGRLDDAMMNLLSEKGRMTEDVQESLDAFERQSKQELNVRNAEIAGSYAGALAERCNLVNTVMGYSAQSAYSQAVREISAEVDRQGVVNVLNEGAASVVSGNMSLQEATRKTIHKLAEKGLPGFTDRAGRQWSPEAYVRMDLRSTMGNTARAAQDARCDAYGIDLIEVSSHLGARPKCAPYQGRIFSRDGSRGITEDLNGNPIEYIPLSETSYGEPDGLFGINCGHQQYPFMPGLSLKTYYPYDEAENAERYEETQRQRALERKIRADKRECMMLQEAGDTEGLQKAAGQLRADRDRYKDFCREKGLAAHNENTQVLGYDRSKSMKTVWAEKKGLTESTERGIIDREINGQRRSRYYLLTEDDITHIKREAQAIGIPTEMLIFNKGDQTGFSDRLQKINIRGDIFPDLSSEHNRDLLSERAVLAHEYYGHYKSYPSKYPVGDWRDEFEASYNAAINTPNLSTEDRARLMIDAYDRAREAGHPRNYDDVARRLIYGY